MTDSDWTVLKEYFKTASQERRAGNRESSPKLLEQAGLSSSLAITVLT